MEKLFFSLDFVYGKGEDFFEEINNTMSDKNILTYLGCIEYNQEQYSGTMTDEICFACPKDKIDDLTEALFKIDYLQYADDLLEVYKKDFDSVKYTFNKKSSKFKAIKSDDFDKIIK